MSNQNQDLTDQQLAADGVPAGLTGDADCLFLFGGTTPC